MQAKGNFLFILFGLCMVISAPSQTLRGKIDTLVQAYCETGCYNGVVLVSARGKIILKKAYGIADRELNVPMTTEMKFRILLSD